MKRFKYTAIIMAMVFFAQFLSIKDANAQFFKSKHTVKIEKKNKELQHKIDSLNKVIEDYMYMLDYRDSIDTMFSYDDSTSQNQEIQYYTPHITDSLLNIWYLHRKTKPNKEGEYDMESVHFTSNTPDAVYLERLKNMNSPITLPYNETVRNFIILYSEKMPTKMANMLGLAEYYMPIFEEVFNKYDMPEELKYVAVIESAFNPVAVSRAGAKGMWQFMYGTAKMYGLKINSFVDERFDPVKSADAAARYLKDAYRVFGDWNLAISSYNCGAGNVNKAIRRCGNNKDFWAIYDYLPRETRGYVPAFVGAMYAFKYYKEHGLKANKIQAPVQIDTFHINRNLHFQQIEDLVGISCDNLRSLNPQYVHDIIPGNEGMYVLRIPARYTSAFIEAEDSLYSHRAKELFNAATLENIKTFGSATQDRIVYKVKKGDILGRIAARHKVTVSQIKKWNHLKSNNLRIGQKLVIYKKGVVRKVNPVPQVQKPVEKQEDTTKTQCDTTQVAGSAENQIYVVKKGDTLFSISQKYEGVTVKDIIDLNNIVNNEIKIGMELKIPNKTKTSN